MSTKSHNKSFQAPKGTRDFYPEELLRRRYIAETWRAVSIRHGFEEIDGPTFEHADLYTVKSGEGILSELFSFRREGGDDLYALRPEFTPTLARMFAARARQLPSPTRWFCIPNFFRAENPQRGRLREFFQWNVDVIGMRDARGGMTEADADVIACVVDCMSSCGLRPSQVDVRFNHRDALRRWLVMNHGIPDSLVEQALLIIDDSPKVESESLIKQIRDTLNFDDARASELAADIQATIVGNRIPIGAHRDIMINNADQKWEWDLLPDAIDDRRLSAWLFRDTSIVRGLAYYTGTVFEVIAEGERAIAGGGRYDNLVELFGGPPTPACGFGMGDVVLSLVLEDRGLMPSGMSELMDAVECVMRSYSMRPDAFVFSNGDAAAEARVVPLMAELRRGVEAPGYQGRPWRPERYAVRPMHVRTTGKSTRNVGKLLKDAASSNARFAVILESGEHATVKDLTTGEEHKDTPIEKIARIIAG